MLISFFLTLRRMGVPVSVRECLDLISALDKGLSFADMNQFYYLARSTLVKDEKFFDRYDRAFILFFNEVKTLDDLTKFLIPENWIYKEFIKHFSDSEKKNIQSIGDFEKLIEEFRARMDEQKGSHRGGNKWIGTGGTSPYGSGGYNPEGIRIGGHGIHMKATKIWERRDFNNLDDNQVVSRRNIKLAMRRLRKFVRIGKKDQFDLDATISATAKNAGLLDIKMLPERKNIVKLILFLDVGGSMDPYSSLCRSLFSAAKSEFKFLKFFYFHNCIYESVWEDNARRHQERTFFYEILHKYSPDYNIIILGDASMSPYEIIQPGGSIEHWNDESGEIWLRRLCHHYRKVVWLNPLEKNHWGLFPSISMINTLVSHQMYPLTINGLERAMSFLSK